MCSKAYVLRIVCSENCAVVDESIKIGKLNIFIHVYTMVSGRVRI